VHEVDAPGDGLDAVDDAGEVLPAGVRVAGVQAEADEVHVAALGQHVPQPADPIQRPGHRVVATGGVLDQDRQRRGHALERLAPVVVADAGVVVLEDVAAVHDQALGPDRRRGRRLVGEDLAAGDADPVVGRGDVDEVGRVHVEVDPGLLRGCTQRGRAPVVRDLRSLPALGVAEEELREVRAAGGRLGDRVDLVDVGTDSQRGRAGSRRRHDPTLTPRSDRRPVDGFPGVRRAAVG
jgi:hypothetical protein